MNSVSFSGKAYFFNDVKKTMTPAQQQKLENFAKNAGEQDVLILGQKKELMYEYDGKTYTQSQTQLASDKETGKALRYLFNGSILAKPEDIRPKEKPLPIFEAQMLNPEDTVRFQKDGDYFITDEINKFEIDTDKE